MTKKDDIMASAQALVLEKGFTATSLDEICCQAGVTKGGFFHYFKNKEDLGMQLVDHYAQATGQAVMSYVDQAGPDPLDRVLSYIDATAQICLSADAKGCLIGTMTQELHESHPKITCCCGVKMMTMRDALARDLQAALDACETKTDMDVQGVADLFITTVQGGFILAKATQDRSILQRVLDQYRSYVKSLFDGS